VPQARSDAGLVDAVVQLSFTVQAMLNDIAAEFELSMTQVRLLGILRDREPTMLELAGALRLEKSSVSGLVDRAQRRGLVRRSPAPDDGRAVRVALADDGRRLATEFEQRVAGELAALLAGLPSRERRQLASLLGRITPVGAG
jgi:DNA-binding MarR family transcriptional regulator